MRKWICAVMLLVMLIQPFGARAENAVPFTCAEQGYATLVDPAWRAEWVDGDGVYYHFEEDNMPYVLAWVNSGGNRITDGAAFLSEELGGLQEKYSLNGGVSTSQYGEFSVGGRPVSAADMQYFNSQGLKIYLLIVVDVREDFTAIYHARYLDDSQRQCILDALGLIDANMRLTGRTESPAPQIGGAAAGVQTFFITDVQETENGFGRCVAPAGYDVQWGHTCCTFNNSISIPHRLAILAECPERGVMMRYFSGADYLSTVDGSTARDGEFDENFYTPILHYMDASAYCDYLAVENFPELAGSMKLVSEDTLPKAREALERLAGERVKALNDGTGSSGLFSLEREGYTICKKRYSCDYNGTPHDIVVLTACLAVRIKTSYEGLKVEGGKLVFGKIETSAISWETPFIYILTCPSENWAEGSAAFELFTANTRASDQFNEANRKLAKALWKIVEESHGLESGRDYSERTLREEAEKGDDYDLEQVTDYIFDQNDYTLSDGSRVKVSTAYDYVYEGDNGAVYYSNSALAEPGGSTRLYPNR